MTDWTCETAGCDYTTPDVNEAIKHVGDSIPTGNYHTMGRDNEDSTATITAEPHDDL